MSQLPGSDVVVRLHGGLTVAGRHRTWRRPRWALGRPAPPGPPGRRSCAASGSFTQLADVTAAAVTETKLTLRVDLDLLADVADVWQAGDKVVRPGPESRPPTVEA